MATLTGSTISSSYDQLLALPAGGGASTTLVALTDGNAGTTFALEISTAGIRSTGTLVATGATTLSTNLTLATGATVTGINDTDAFSDASATTLATSESIQEYADANVMGIGTFAVGDLLYASTTSALTKLAAGGSGNVLKISGGVPAWGAVAGTGTVTSVASGNGLSGGPITGAGTLALDINGATNGTSITVATNDELLVADTDDSNNVKRITVSQLPGGDTLPIVDGTAVVKDPADATKLVRIDAGALTTDTTRVITMGDRNVDLASGGTFSEKLSTLTDISGTGDASGWSAGDTLAIVDSGDSNNSKRIKLPAEIGIACSDETTAITAGNTAADTQKASILIPRAMTVTEIKCNLYKKDSSTVTIDVNYHATAPESAVTLLNNPASDLSMATTALTASTTTFASAATSYVLADNSFVTVDVDAAGTNALGLKVWLLGYWT